MKENRKLLKEVLKDIRHDMTDEEVLNLLADSKISVSPESEKEKYTLPINNHGTKVVNPFIGVIPTHGELEDELEQIYEAM